MLAVMALQAGSYMLLDALKRDRKAALDVTNPLVGIFGGMLLVVIGLILSVVVIDTAATTGSDAQTPSFTGVRSVNDVVPLIFTGGIALLGMFIMVGSGIKFYKGRD